MGGRGSDAGHERGWKKTKRDDGSRERRDAGPKKALGARKTARTRASTGSRTSGDARHCPQPHPDALTPFSGRADAP